MASSPLAILNAALANFKPDAGVLAGGGASLLVFLAGCALVGAGVAIPPISIFGAHLIATSIPLTMTMVAAAAPTIGHLVSSFVPATYNQQIDALAKKIGTDVENLKAVVPVLQEEFPAGKNGQTDSDNPPPSQSNINKS